MRIGSFEFNLRELAGSFGDFGTLFPLAIGYIAVCGLDPAGFLVMIGLANIATGLVYRLPMPIEPVKVLAVVAITQRWAPSMVYASGFAMGVVWLLFGLTGVMGWIAQATPRSVVRGIQISLGVLLVAVAIIIILLLLLRNNRYAPASVVLIALGVGLIALRGELRAVQAASFRLPPLTIFSLEGLLEICLGLFLAGSIASLFSAFPTAIIGAMMLLVGVEMVKFPRDVRLSLELIPLGLTVAVSVVTNMALGFAAGTAAHYLLRLITHEPKGGQQRTRG